MNPWKMYSLKRQWKAILRYHHKAINLAKTNKNDKNPVRPGLWYTKLCLLFPDPQPPLQLVSDFLVMFCGSCLVTYGQELTFYASQWKNLSFIFLSLGALLSGITDLQLCPHLALAHALRDRNEVSITVTTLSLCQLDCLAFTQHCYLPRVTILSNR